MNRRSRATLLVAALVSSLGGATAFAQAGNLVPNGRFDDADEVQGWTQSGSGSFEWEEFDDEDLCTGSGSFRAIAASILDSGSTSYTSDCIGGVDDESAYRLSGAFWFDLGGFVDGHAQVHTRFLDGPDCTGSTISSPGFFAGLAQPTVSNWQRFSVTSTPPAGSQSLNVRIFVVKADDADPELQVLVDEVFFGLATALFADDFEVGADCRWSVSSDDIP